MNVQFYQIADTSSQEDNKESASAEEPKPTPQLKGLIKAVSQLETNSIMISKEVLNFVVKL